MELDPVVSFPIPVRFPLYQWRQSPINWITTFPFSYVKEEEGRESKNDLDQVTHNVRLPLMGSRATGYPHRFGRLVQSKNLDREKY